MFNLLAALVRFALVVRGALRAVSVDALPIFVKLLPYPSLRDGG